MGFCGDVGHGVGEGAREIHRKGKANDTQDNYATLRGARMHTLKYEMTGSADR